MVRASLMTLRGVHTLLLRNSLYVILHDKKALADVTKVKDIEMGTLTCIIQVCPSTWLFTS